MPWTRINGMPESPQRCAACGGNPVDVGGRQQEAMWYEGVDIDWGNMLYICMDCADIIADLAGRVTKEGFDRLTKKYEDLLEEHDEFKGKYEHAESLLEKIREGGNAQREVRQTAKR